ncbi:MAG: hypothetical protein QXP42_05635 [Candidatus Micrarchaeia archaeon]
MKFKRAQAATEYLIILAVVVIIALIVVGVMGGFPRIGRGVTKAESDAYWSVAEVAIIGASLKGTNGEAGQLIVRNNKKFPINIDQIGIGVAPANVQSVSPTRLEPGDTAIVNITSGTNYPSGTAGEEYSLDVTIKYRDAEHTTMTYSFTGSLPLVGQYQ